MLIQVMKSKISYARVTGKDLHYVGSITIDKEWMEAAHIVENERVQVVNLSNGERLETYVITGEAGSRAIQLNGPAARRCEEGDVLFIISYALIDPHNESLEPCLIQAGEPTSSGV